MYEDLAIRSQRCNRSSDNNDPVYGFHSGQLVTISNEESDEFSWPNHLPYTIQITNGDGI